MTAPQTFTTPNGRSLTLFVRSDTNDAALAHGILDEDEYHLGGTSFSGWALDIGAHIGIVGLALAVDNPDIRVVLVEPVPDNCDLIRRSIAANGLDERCFVEEAAAAGPGASTVEVGYDYTAADVPDQGYVQQNRYIGGMWRSNVASEGKTVEARAVNITTLAFIYASKFILCKIDAEGAEYEFFKDPSVDLIAIIIGEWHDGPFSRIKRLLGKTHRVEMLADHDGTGIFRAVHR